jgi:hypothetical protein
MHHYLRFVMYDEMGKRCTSPRTSKSRRKRMDLTKIGAYNAPYLTYFLCFFASLC